MPVIFDEVIGTVLPDTAPQSSAVPAPVAPLDSLKIRVLLRRMERRAARLKAD